MRRLAAFALVAPVLFGSWVPLARADWTVEGDTLWGDSHVPGAMDLVADGSGGLLVWWGSFGGGGGDISRARRVASTGSIYPNWDWNNTPSSSKSLPDGAGGLFKTFPGFDGSDAVINIHHVLPTGGLDPLWPSFGTTAGRPFNPGHFGAVRDDAGGAFVTYRYSDPFVPAATRLLVKHVLANGTIDPSWPGEGLPLDWPATGSTIILAGPPDGAGGAYFAWVTDRVRVQRVAGNGAVASGWPIGGLALSPSSPTGTTKFIGCVASGSDHYFVAWSMDSASTRNVWLQRYHQGGTLDPGWPGAVRVNGSGAMTDIQMIRDESDGVVLAWRDAALPRGLRVLADGSAASGWADGLSLLDAGAVFPGGYRVATGRAGGVVTIWNDERRPDQRFIRARWLQADGALDPGTPDSGRAVHLPGTHAYLMGAMGDGTGDAFVGWSDDTHFSWWRVMLTKVPYPGVVGVPPGPTGNALVLGAPWPNPARDDLNVRFSLPDNSPARLELLDLAGRRVRSREVSGAGPHVERFERVQGLPSGVYLVRVSHGTQVRAALVAVIR